MKHLLTYVLIFFCCASVQASPIIPKPGKLSYLRGSFLLNQKTSIIYSKGSKGKAKQLANYLKADLGLKVTVTADSVRRNKISLKLDKSMKSKISGTYKMKVTAQAIEVTASDKAGLFYAIQTIRQLLPMKGKKAKINAMLIDDSPRYQWRGMMLDVSRQFMDKDYVKRYLDMMAMHKLNVFHWHLIDDSGWRIEIKKYPKLTKLGAWTTHNGKPHGGFYTQEDIKEIVKYAAERHIEVVPEIEIPAHTLSALVAYPYLGCDNKQFKVPNRHSISRELYCGGKESTYTFIKDIMKEVFEMFPGKYIHIGGDEAFKERWKTCKHCQGKIKKEGLKDVQELQGYMTRFFEKLCQKENRQIIGWDEILKCNISKSAGLMVWHNTHHAYEGAKKGHPVVAAYVRHTYFDTAESRLPGELSAATWTPPVTLSHAYNWDPTPTGLTEDEAKNILGGHGCLWTDKFLHNHALRDRDKNDNRSEVYVDMLSLPRMAALAEAVWTPKKDLDFDNFKKRMRLQYRRYEKAGFHYRLPLPAVEVSRKKGGFTIKAKSSIKGGKVHYTTDGSTPTVTSPVLKQSVVVKKESDFKAISATADGKRQSLVYAVVKHNSKYDKYGTKIGRWKAGKVGSKKAKSLIWEATGLIDKNAKYQVTFIYTGGATKLMIDWVEILKNDKVIKRVDRQGYTGGTSKGNTYDFNIKEYETGASFKVRAGVYGDVDNNSNGLIFIKKK